MAYGPRYRVPRRRRREGKTNYKTRLNLLKSGETRAIVRKSQKSIVIQFIAFDPIGDRVLSSANGYDLEKFGWQGSVANTPAAYLTGYLAGKRAISKGVTNAILDIGLQPPQRGSRLFASLKGIVDAGVEIPYSEEILPSPERIRGEHINESMKTQFETVKTKLEGAK
jgi:large subunit ribosomal protein L18